jgi:hypothetical protein
VFVLQEAASLQGMHAGKVGVIIARGNLAVDTAGSVSRTEAL